MRPKLIFCFPAIVFLQAGLAQNVHLNRLLTMKRFPELEKAIQQPGISQQEKDLYTVFLLNAYGDADGSNHLIRSVRQSGIVKKNDSLDFYLYQAECDNHVKLFHYKEASGLTDLLLSRYSSFYKAQDLEDEKRGAEVWKYLSGQKPQRLSKTADTRIPLTKDLAGLSRLPVTMGDTTVNFIFDTGAGFSVITRRYAQKMKVHLLDSAFVDIKSGVTGIATKVQLGIAPEMKLGNITVYDVVFLVFPDEAFTFADGAYVIEGILGFPVMKAFGQFTIENNELFVPEKILPVQTERNMALDLLKPVIYMHYRGTVLPFTFDSGANTSTFSDNFYRAYRTHIDTMATRKEVRVGGAGGIKTVQMLIVPELVFEVHGKTVSLKNVEVSTEEISTNGEIYYGNIGQDLIGQFKKMTMSFAGSYILFE